MNHDTVNTLRGKILKRAYSIIELANEQDNVQLVEFADLIELDAREIAKQAVALGDEG